VARVVATLAIAPSYCVAATESDFHILRASSAIAQAQLDLPTPGAIFGPLFAVARESHEPRLMSFGRPARSRGFAFVELLTLCHAGLLQGEMDFAGH
jgi:hypothetical protein